MTTVQIIGVPQDLGLIGVEWIWVLLLSGMLVWLTDLKAWL